MDSSSKALGEKSGQLRHRLVDVHWLVIERHVRGTLDDEQIASVGVAPVSRVVFGLGARVARIALGAGHFVLTSFRWTVTGAALVLAAQIAQVQLSSNWSGAMRDGTFDPYLAVVFALLEGNSPVRYFAPTLPGVFAILATAVALGIAGLLVMCAAMLAASAGTASAK